MELRSTTKVYLFNKAISKTPLSKAEFNVLYTVFINKNNSRLTDIHFRLMYAKRQTGYNYLRKYLCQLAIKGYVDRKGFRYSATTTGMNALKEVEARLRKSRVN